MSRTAPALARIDTLLPVLQGLAAGADRDQLVVDAEALRRAIAAFHMEAIRFRMYSVERRLKTVRDPEAQRLFEALRADLEAAGFHTRSHIAP